MLFLSGVSFILAVMCGCLKLFFAANVADNDDSDSKVLHCMELNLIELKKAF